VLKSRRWWGQGSLALLLGAAGALVVEPIVVTLLGADWAGSFDVMQGGCGWDGTCSDAGTLEVSIYGLLVLIMLDVGAGFLLARRAIRRRAGAIQASSAPVASTGLVCINCIELAIIGVGVASLGVFLQTAIIGRIADQRYPGIPGWQPAARFLFMWSTTLPAAELVAVAVALLSVAFWRRARQSAE
jgi:hypothetical protein